MAESVAQVEKAFACASREQRKELIKKYEADSRKGVQKIVAAAKKREEKFRAELDRLEGMQVYEKKYAKFCAICGIDEAGRGPLAGPVAAAACILPKDAQILYLNDSKQLSAKMREKLCDEITQKAVSYGVGLISPERIDKINILNATYEAMRKAIDALSVPPDLLLVDALTIPQVDVKQVGIVKGDQKSVSIAAGSIIAKVTRDKIMAEYDKLYPEYGFGRHKGYGTKEHIAAIQKYGACPIHRQTFIQKFLQG